MPCLESCLGSHQLTKSISRSFVALYPRDLMPVSVVVATISHLPVDRGYRRRLKHVVEGGGTLIPLLFTTLDARVGAELLVKIGDAPLAQ
jgi:hypothetical protein